MIKIIRDEPGHLLIMVDVSEANLENAELFKSQVTQLFDRHKKNIIIDMSKVEYIDSSFLGALVAVLKYALARKLDILLVNLCKDVYDLLLLIRLDKVFKIYDNYEEAITHL